MRYLDVMHTGQGPFRQFDLANDTGGMPDVVELVSLINELLPDGVELPQGTTTANLVERLRIVVNTLANMAVAEGAAPPDKVREYAMQNRHVAPHRRTDAEVRRSLLARGKIREAANVPTFHPIR